MSAISNYLENALINHVFRNVSYTPPATIYVALYTTNPTDADVGVEVSGGGYVRQAVTFVAPSSGATSNATDVVFPEATTDWGTITHLGLRDADIGGNLLWYGPLSTSKTVLAGDQLIFKAGQLTISLD